MKSEQNLTIFTRLGVYTPKPSSPCKCGKWSINHSITASRHDPFKLDIVNTRMSLLNLWDYNLENTR